MAIPLCQGSKLDAKAEAQGGEILKRGKEALEQFCTETWGPGAGETVDQASLGRKSAICHI